MTSSGDLLDFGQLFEAFLKSSTFLGNFCEGVKIYLFLLKSFLGNFYRKLEIFSGHTVYKKKVTLLAHVPQLSILDLLRVQLSLRVSEHIASTRT